MRFYNKTSTHKNNTPNALISLDQPLSLYVTMSTSKYVSFWAFFLTALSEYLALQELKEFKALNVF